MDHEKALEIVEAMMKIFVKDIHEDDMVHIDYIHDTMHNDLYTKLVEIKP